LRRVVEISGTEQEGELRRRHREKASQMLANPRHWDGYVFVCYFGPARGLIRWTYHRQQEVEDAAT
jgi:hypothetical protein